MIFKCKSKRPDLWYTEWHRWFAWRPVRLEDGIHCVWLQWVERRDISSYWVECFYWDYRLPQEKKP